MKTPQSCSEEDEIHTLTVREHDVFEELSEICQFLDGRLEGAHRTEGVRHTAQTIVLGALWMNELQEHAPEAVCALINAARRIARDIKGRGPGGARA